jgi:curved DNA-binding protein CbpA
MNESALINPFALFGITSDNSLNELKRVYYNMALLCHPDKGGSNNDMYIVHNAYNYCKEQLENQKQKQTTYEQLEDEFAMFCKTQEDTLPPFSSIYEETSDWINEFNCEFNKLNITQTDKVEMFDPFKDGYGELMDTSDTIEEYNPEEQTEPQTVFDKQIIEYKEPSILPDTVTHFPLNVEHIDDYSGNVNALHMTDYYKSFEGHQQLNETDFEFKDYPNNDMQL